MCKSNFQMNEKQNKEQSWIVQGHRTMINYYLGIGGIFLGEIVYAPNPSGQAYAVIKQKLPDIQAEFRKDRRIRANCQNSLNHGERKGIAEKHLLLFHWLNESL